MLVVDRLTWEEQEVADGMPVTTLVRFPHCYKSTGFSVLVNFPAGWERTNSGYYESTEEVLVLNGSLIMSDSELKENDYGWYPAGYLREDSKSQQGALVFAWFSGPARWKRATSTPADLGFDPAAVIHENSDNISKETDLFNSRNSKKLRSDEFGSTWLVEGTKAAPVPERCMVNMFLVAEKIWYSVGPEEELPALESKILLRIMNL